MSSLIYIMDREEIIKAILLYLDEEKGFKSVDGLCEFYYRNENLEECRVTVELIKR